MNASQIESVMHVQKTKAIMKEVDLATDSLDNVDNQQKKWDLLIKCEMNELFHLLASQNIMEIVAITLKFQNILEQKNEEVTARSLHAPFVSWEERFQDTARRIR